MASPFFDAISAGVSSAPGTGTFSIGTVTSGFRAFSNVASGAIVQYRAEEGTSWEIGMGYWNGSTLTRKVMHSSTGSLVSFTAAAIISLTIPADKVAQHPGLGCYGIYVPGAQSATNYSSISPLPGVFGEGSATVSGSEGNFPSSVAAIGRRFIITSGSSANNAHKVYWNDYSAFKATYNGVGQGFEMVSRVGILAVPTGSKFIFGLDGGTGSGDEPSVGSNKCCFTKNSTEANWMFRTGAGTAAIDTGVSVTSGSVYEMAVWCDPGTSGRAYGSIAKIGSSEIWFGNDAANPVSSNSMVPCLYAGQASSSSGTSSRLCTTNVYVRHGI